CPARTGWPRVPPASTASVCPAPPTAPAPPAPPALAAGCIARAPASPSSATETLPCPCGSRDLSAIFPVARTTRSSTALLLRLPRSLHLLQPLQVPLLALPELLLGRRRATAPTRSSTFPVLHPAQLRLRHPHLHLRQILRPVRRSLHRDRRHRALHLLVRHRPVHRRQVRRYQARRYQVRRHILPHRRPHRARRRPLHRHPALRLLVRHRRVRRHRVRCQILLHPRFLHPCRLRHRSQFPLRRRPGLLHLHHRRLFLHLRLHPRLSPLPTNYRPHQSHRSSSSLFRFPILLCLRLALHRQIPVRSLRRRRRRLANFPPPGSVAAVYSDLQKCRAVCRHLRPAPWPSAAPPP